MIDEYNVMRHIAKRENGLSTGMTILDGMTILGVGGRGGVRGWVEKVGVGGEWHQSWNNPNLYLEIFSSPNSITIHSKDTGNSCFSLGSSKCLSIENNIQFIETWSQRIQMSMI